MLRSLAFAFACGLAGYLIGAFSGGWLMTKLSSNMHDRSTEAAMTGAFVYGPALALIAFIVGFVRSR
jgi:ABC-type antimicrobial peptide transport system permease subunit